MRMLVMCVGHVWMSVLGWLVAMPVAVRAGGHHLMTVRVVVVAMGVRVLMLKGLVRVGVFVTLCQVQHHAANHEHATHAHQPRPRPVTQGKGAQSTDEGREREHRARARGAELALR